MMSRLDSKMRSDTPVPSSPIVAVNEGHTDEQMFSRHLLVFRESDNSYFGFSETSPFPPNRKFE